MEEQTQNLQAAAPDTESAVNDPEKTLVAPRFGAREVVTAQPVVPLTDAPLGRRQGTLPILLILISALVGGLVSVFAYRLYQQRVQQSAAAVEAPALTPEIPARASSAETPDSTPEVIEEPTPATEVAEVREATASEEAAERGEARDDGADPDLEAAREEPPATRGATRRPSARRVEEITTPTEDLRVRRGRYDGKEATDYEVPRRTRASRRAQRRAAERNIDRVRAIFEGPPPTQ
jgi:hypothetical protein